MTSDSLLSGPTNTLHVVIGGDPSLVGLQEQLSGAGLTSLLLPTATLPDLVQAIREHSNGALDSISLYTHGQAGALDLGGWDLNTETLRQHRDDLAALGHLLTPQGDLLLYGCSVGAGDAGRAFTTELARLTDADVAASTNATGTSRLNSDQDWSLETATGSIETDNTDLLTGLAWTGRLAVTPNTRVTQASWTDADGDRVEISLTGGGSASFAVTLAGGASDQADATALQLFNTTAANSLSIRVTPQRQIDAGSAPEGSFNRLYSAGYTSIARIGSGATGSSAALGSLSLSGAIVNSIDLGDYRIGNITLDAGQTAYVDRINTSEQASNISVAAPSIGVTNTNNSGPTELELFDESPTGAGSSTYKPVAGLIDLGDIRAASIDSLVVNGVISADTRDPNATGRKTNDLRGTISVSGAIGRIDAQRSILSGQVRAASIGVLNVGRIEGEVTTTDASKSLTLSLPSIFHGFVNVAGHLNLGYSLKNYITVDSRQVVRLNTGEITAGGGISGSKASLTDDILLPDAYRAVIRNTSRTAEIANLRFNGTAASRWISAGSIGSITANGFAPDAIFEAADNIGSIESYLYREVPPADPTNPPNPPEVFQLDGFFRAGGNIGNVKSATGIKADLKAGGSIGNITALTGGIDSKLIEAGTRIGNLYAQAQDVLNTGKIVAGNGDIGSLTVARGNWGSSLRAVKGSIGPVSIQKGSLQQVAFAADQSITGLTVRGTGAITGGSFVAGESIGSINVSAATGPAILGALFEAGDANGQYRDRDGTLQTSRISGVQVVAYGATTLDGVTPGLTLPDPGLAHGIENTRFLAGSIGAVSARAHTASGIVASVIHAKVDSIASITGIGHDDGLKQVTAVGQKSIGAITGISQVQGSGIFNSRFNANDNNIGMVTGRGGVAGGHGIDTSYFQASREDANGNGVIQGFTATTNANDGDAIRAVTANAGRFGSITATVLGGEGGQPGSPRGSGIVNSEFRGFGPRTDTTPIGLNSIRVDVRSIQGQGIVNSRFQVKGNIQTLNVSTFNATAITGSEFNSTQGDIVSITSSALNGGSAIADGSLFEAGNGNIGLDRRNGSGGITARTGGRSPLSHGIEGSTFRAGGDIGNLNSQAKGGSAIIGSTFEADTSYTNLGRIRSVTAISQGQNIAASTGISTSTFEAGRIGAIRVDVEDFDGGTAISGSTFTARTASYDPGTGEVNNRGIIDSITVRSKSRIGDGIEGSQFLAGAAGQIGSINVDVTWRKLTNPDSDVTSDYNRAASGRAIYLSSFRASSLDPDQGELRGRIGSITVKAGRVAPELIPDFLLPGNNQPPNDQATAAAAGIDTSYFAAYGGIGNITIDSIGTGVFGSAFLGNLDPVNGIAGVMANALAEPGKKANGRIGNVTVRATGKYASGVVLSLVTGSSVGNTLVEAKGFPIPSLNLPALRNLPNNAVIQSIQAAQNAGSLLPILQAGAASLLNGLNNLFSFNTSPIAGAAFIATTGNIGSITIRNTNRFGNYPFLGSLFYARGSYGPVTTTPLAIKAPGDLMAEATLTSLGFTTPNVFTFYPLPTTFIGRVRPGGNLPTPALS